MANALHYPAGVQARFTKRLLKIVKVMRRHAEANIKRLFKSTEAKKYFATDESFYARAQRLLDEMEKKYGTLFSTFGDAAVKRMIKETNKESDIKMRAAFQELEKQYDIEIGFNIGEMPQKVRSILKASTEEAVSLIRSVPAKFLEYVKGDVFRAITSGKGGFSKIVESIKHYGSMSAGRARRIAKDQTKKAFSSLNIAKAKGAGIQKGIWIHSGSPVHPRIKHKNFSGKVFDLSVGAPVGDRGQYVMPAEEPFCSCVWKPILSF